MESKTTAKDFVLHLATIAGLYTLVISFVSLLFTLIDKVYPDAFFYSNYYNISMPIATLIIVFPLFIFLSWLIEKSYAEDPGKKQIGIRRGLTYITLLIAGIILVGDLVTLLYTFLDGQDFTVTFILKACVILCVLGLVFGYYLQDIRDKIPTSRKKIWAIVTGIIILCSIVMGFSIIGSPKTQRLLRYDEKKVNDLQNIQRNLVGYYQKKGTLPATINELLDPISGVIIPEDPQTGLPYEYKKISETSFQLCATFNLENTSNINPDLSPSSTTMDYWIHKSGNQCFDRTIDTELYPIFKNK